MQVCPACHGLNLDMGVELGGVILFCSQCFVEECDNMGGGPMFGAGAWPLWKEIYPPPWIKGPCMYPYGHTPQEEETRKPLEDLLCPSPVWAEDMPPGDLYLTGENIMGSETMCVKVKLDIQQETTLERQGFEALLKLGNLRTDYDMAVSIDLDIRDAEGNPAND